MRFVLFFGTITAFAGVWAALNYLPEDMVRLVALIVSGGISATIFLWFLWRLCRAAYPPKEDRS